ncbi:hypothetical protein Tco_1039255 [Tanacetum coccineum]
MPAPNTQPLDADAGSDEIASDGNVDLYYEARVSNTAGDVLERDLFPFVPVPYYIPYPYDEGSGTETHRLRELSSVELSDRMSVLQCQLITHENMLNARYDYSLRNVKRLTKRYAQQTQTIKKQGADLKQQKESTVHANEEVSRLTGKLEVLKSRCQTVKHKLSSWDKKHRKQAEEIQGSIASFFQSDFTTLVRRFLKSSEFNRTFAGVLDTAISVRVEPKEKFDRAIAAFPDTTFPFLDKVSQHSQSFLLDIARLEPDRVTSSHQTSSVAQSLRANTHIRHSTSSSFWSY